MPIYSVTISKHPVASETPVWSNVYHVSAGTIEDAHAFAVGNIYAFEQTIHCTTVQFAEVRTSDQTVGTDVFISEPVDGIGGRALSGDEMPRFLALRLDIVRGLGRPLRKFYHPCLGENAAANREWEATYLDLVDTEWDDLVAAGHDVEIVFTSRTGGSAVTGGRPVALITQHQFKRKWARRIAIH